MEILLLFWSRKVCSSSALSAFSSSHIHFITCSGKDLKNPDCIILLCVNSVRLMQRTATAGCVPNSNSPTTAQSEVRTLSSRSSSLSSISSSLRLHSYSTWMWGLNFPSAACISCHMQTNTSAPLPVYRVQIQTCKHGKQHGLSITVEMSAFAFISL